MSTPTAAAEAALERGDYGQCLQLLDPARAESHVRPRVCQGHGKVPAETARCPGDKRRAPA